MDQRTEDAYLRQRKAAEKTREHFRQPEKWERSPKVDFPLLAVTNSDRQAIVQELSRAPITTQELLKRLPFISQRLLSEHLIYLAEAGLVSWQRIPRKATKIWTLDLGLLSDVIDDVQRLDAGRYKRVEARKLARRVELARKIAEIKEDLREEVREELRKEAALERLLED